MLAEQQCVALYEQLDAVKESISDVHRIFEEELGVSRARTRPQNSRPSSVSSLKSSTA
jgi:hypothetical protein